MDIGIRKFRVSTDAKDQLIRLKRFTGIKQWNVLCRWALCRSLAEPTPPSPAPLPPQSNVEMSWEVFAGPLSDTIVALLRQRCHEDGLDATDQVVTEQFRLHLHRGIAYLSQENVGSIADMVGKALADDT